MATKFRAVPHHRRLHSWPPIRHLPSHLQHHTQHPAKPTLAPEVDIDEDPFAFFLSSPGDPDGRVVAASVNNRWRDESDDSDNETYVSDWMNANIDDSASRGWPSQRRTRSVSPNRPCSGSDVMDNYAYAAAQLARPVSPGTAINMLRKWLERMETMYFHRKPTCSESSLSEVAVPTFPASPPATPGRVASPVSPDKLQPGLASPLVRGRKRVRRSSRSVGNRAIRSRSGHVRVWHGPAEDMYPLSEEEEYEEAATPVSM